ncbi:MAG: hypothetical protein JRI23_18405, partial [Deltaproteobacteria bacterium]|nr:hypothetical protein [Deltaproteobacteria bacterium]MBW2533830.1 hypothetical protein [Deltaproteobacteria bacterium]
MDRYVAVVSLALALCAASCGDDDDDGPSCALRTTGLSGEGPTCMNSLECGDDEWRLECDGIDSGTCTCLHNGVEEKTIPYDDAYCPADFSTADFEAHE